MHEHRVAPIGWKIHENRRRTTIVERCVIGVVVVVVMVVIERGDVFVRVIYS